MAFGFPHPRYVESRAFHLAQDQLPAAVRAAIESLQWTDKGSTENEFQARVPWSAFVWAHDVRINILPNSVLQVESKSTARENFYDFGRNRRNVEAFFARIEQMTGSESRKVL